MVPYMSISLGLCLLKATGVSAVFNSCEKQEVNHMPYDNTSNLSGKYKGFQAQIKGLNPLALYMPCTAHSLSFIGRCNIDCYTEAIKLYGFFPYHPGDGSFCAPRVSKENSLSDMRWSCHSESRKTVVNYESIQCLKKQWTMPKKTAKFTGKHDCYTRKCANWKLPLSRSILWNVILERYDKLVKLQ